MVLSDPKYLQGKVNKLMRKTVQFSSNPFSKDDGAVESEDEETEEARAKREHIAKMEEGGFIMVLPEG